MVSVPMDSAQHRGVLQEPERAQRRLVVALDDPDPALPIDADVESDLPEVGIALSEPFGSLQRGPRYFRREAPVLDAGGFQRPKQGERAAGHIRDQIAFGRRFCIRAGHGPRGRGCFLALDHDPDVERPAPDASQRDPLLDDVASSFAFNPQPLENLVRAAHRDGVVLVLHPVGARFGSLDEDDVRAEAPVARLQDDAGMALQHAGQGVLLQQPRLRQPRVQRRAGSQDAVLLPFVFLDRHCHPCLFHRIRSF